MNRTTMNWTRFAKTLDHRLAGRTLRSASDDISTDIGDVSHSTLSRTIAGKPCDLDTLLILCDWMGVSLSMFLDVDRDIPLSADNTLTEAGYWRARCEESESVIRKVRAAIGDRS